MKQKKAINWIKSICNRLLKCKSDNEAMNYKNEWFRLANNQKVKEKLYGNLVFINNSYDVNNGLEALNIYFKGEWSPFNITLQRLQEFFIPAILKGLKKNEKE